MHSTRPHDGQPGANGFAILVMWDNTGVANASKISLISCAVCVERTFGRRLR